MRLEEVSIIGIDGATATLFEKRLSPRERVGARGGATAPQRGRSAGDARRARDATPRRHAARTSAAHGCARRGSPSPRSPIDSTRRPRAASRRSTPPGSSAHCARRSARSQSSTKRRDASGPLSIVHADLSPANLALDDAGARAVLLDLELASWRGAPPPRDGAFRGTVAYCAPETARGEAPTVASDLFALAATFLHAVTGAATAQRLVVRRAARGRGRTPAARRPRSPRVRTARRARPRACRDRALPRARARANGRRRRVTRSPSSAEVRSSHGRAVC